MRSPNLPPGRAAAPAFHSWRRRCPATLFRSPAGPIGPRRGRAIAALMGDVLGYDGYIAQGGDWR